MPKIKWGVSGSDVDAVEPDEQMQDFEPYSGPLPPKNTVLLCDIKWIRATKFNTGSKGLKMLLIVNEDRANLKKYNGMPLFENLVDAPTNDWKIRQFLDSIGATGKDWDNTVIDSTEEKNVVKFGKIAVEGLSIEVRVKRGANQDGEPRAEVAKFLPLNEDDDSGDSGGDTEEDAPF
jgi:hypothetical protein